MKERTWIVVDLTDDCDYETIKRGIKEINNAGMHAELGILRKLLLECEQPEDFEELERLLDENFGAYIKSRVDK